jgi:hypothetical protein
VRFALLCAIVLDWLAFEQGFGRLQLSENHFWSRSAGKIAAAVSKQRLLCVLFAFAFFLQSYAAQTHIHQGISALKASIGDHSNKPADATGNQKAPRPDGDSDANCPLCQAAAHANAYFAPVATPFLLSGSLLSVVGIFATVHIRRFALEYRHQQRGPPLS